MRAFLDTRALSFDDRVFDVADLVLAGLLAGTWLPFERRVAVSVAAAELEPPSRDDVHAAAREYRYARNLLARADLDSWLAARGLITADWHGYLQRTLAVERRPDAVPGDAAPVLRIDAVCSGTLLACAERLVAGAAAARAVGEPAVDELELLAAARATTALETFDDADLARRARVVVALDRAYARLAADLSDEAALRRRIDAHALDWLTFETEELTVTGDDAAREARLCLQEDGLSFAEVAAVSGGVARRGRRVFSDTPGELRTALVAATPGQVVGPLAAGDAHLVARVLRKAPPTIDDPRVSARARDELVAEAVERHSAGRVTWHVAL